MSRSGYSYETDGWAIIRWRGAVQVALNGERGQAALRDLLVAMDAMPVKELIAGELVSEAGQFCALGVLGSARGLDMAQLDPYDDVRISEAFGLSGAMVKEIEFQNDECASDPERRWNYMRAWVAGKIKTEAGMAPDAS